jgi:hypothetical protein
MFRKNKEKISVFKFILTNSRFTFLNKVEYFGFLFLCIGFLLFIIYDFVYDKKFINTFSLYFITLIVIYLLARIYPKFILPYLQKKQKTISEKKFTEEFAKEIKKLSKETIKYDIRIYIIFPSLLLVTSFLFIFLYFLFTNYFGISTLKEYYWIIIKIPFIYAGLFILLFLKWSFEYCKHGYQSYKKLDKITPSCYKKKNRYIKIFFLITFLALIGLMIFGIVEHFYLIENCEKSYTDKNTIDYCFRSNAEKIAASDPLKAMQFCDKILSDYDRKLCISDAALAIAKKNISEAYKFCKLNKGSDDSHYYIISKIQNIEDKLKFCDIEYEDTGDYICYLQIAKEFPQKSLEICDRIKNKDNRESCIEIMKYYKKSVK